MSAKLTWLFVFVGLYWGYCLSAGLIGARAARTVSDFFIAGRRLSLWIFILAATATSFSGWTFMGHPGLVYRDGFSYAYAAFYTITIPLTGVFFLKRQWMLGKHFGYVTPGEMLADYFRGDAIRFLTVFIALLFSIPYVGIQFGASGYLFEVLTDSVINQNLGMWLLALVMLTYLVTGGLRAVAYVDALQCALMIVGIIITGVIALDAVGGWSALTAGMSHMATMPGVETTKGLGGGDYPSYFAIPGVIQYTAGLGKEAPVGGLWTGVMILTYMFAMMGIQASPAFSMWAFANNNPRPFATQQVWVSSFGVGLILLFFTMFQGVGAHLLGADASASRDPHVLAKILRSPDTEILPAPKEPAKLMALYNAGAIALVGPKIARNMALADLEIALQTGAEAAADADAGARAVALIKLGVDPARAERLAGDVHQRDAYLARSADLKIAYGAIYRIERAVTLPAVLTDATFVKPPLPARRIAENPDFLVPEYFNLIAEEHAWLIGLLAICAMAAMQSTGAAYISAAAAMLTRDFHKRYLRPASSHGTQKLFGRVAMILIVVSALLVSTYSRDALVLLGGLAVAFGLQMAPSLAAITWCPWITRQGATYGLVAGILGVVFTENIGLAILQSVGIDLWGRWPLTIHSAGWGLGANLVICAVFSALTQDAADRERRMKYHTFLNERASLPPGKKRLRPLAWAAVLGWLFFGVGPGAVIGNDIFGAPDAGIEGWWFGIPSIWAWQILFWGLGVGMMWFLAYKMEMSTVPEKEIVALVDDVAESARRF